MLRAPIPIHIIWKFLYCCVHWLGIIETTGTIPLDVSPAHLFREGARTSVEKSGTRSFRVVQNKTNFDRPTMVPLEQICNLNNIAVRVLASGYVQRAIFCFEQGLNAFRAELDEWEITNVRQGANRLIQPVKLHPSLTCDDGATFPLAYNYASILPERANTDEIATALLFNYGLALQVKGRTGQESKMLEKAAKLYSMASLFLEDVEISTMMNQDDPSILLLAVGVWNNLASLLGCTLDNDHASACIEQMSSLLDNSPEDVDLVFFRHNVLCHHVCGKAGSCSPAA